MNKDKILKREQILYKKSKLDYARIILKREFVGIDNVIDSVLDSISPWFLFPDIQEKPVIINLWGLTGVGKSSLVNRLAELIDHDQKYYRFDLGNQEKGEYTVKDTLNDLYKKHNGEPVIIALDEFQHARTLDELGKEGEKSLNRVIWDLLDSGSFQFLSYDNRLDDMHELLRNLRYCLIHGVKVENGMVVSGRKLFSEIVLQQTYYARRRRHIGLSVNDEKVKTYSFIPENYFTYLSDILKNKFPNAHETKQSFKGLDGIETVKKLKELFDFAIRPQIVDCSKALVFILGNIDEAYSMSDNFNPDINADEFHEMSLKIKISDIKNALKKRFRSEQIARLGNNHIIYPALNSDSFRMIIELELSKIISRFFEKFQIKIDVEESLKDLLYREGVYPTQGVRPVFTTIQQIVSSHLGKIYTHGLLKNIEPEKIKMGFEDDKMLVRYYCENKLAETLEIPLTLNLESQRKSKKNDMQCITAVHESGHVVLSAIILKVIPEYAYSVSSENSGFMYNKIKWDYISKKEIVYRTAVLLAGLAAERMVFGDENITRGSGSDIQKATSMIIESIRCSGFGQIPAAYNANHPMTFLNSIFDSDFSTNKQAMDIIEQSFQLAQSVLKEQEVLLYRLSDYLSDNPVIKKEQIREMVTKFAVNFSLTEIIEDGDHIFYREHLKNKIKSLQNNEIQQPNQSIAQPLCLNKDENKQKTES